MKTTDKQIEELEVFIWPDIFRAIGPSDDMVVSAEKLKKWLDQERERAVLKARLDELNRLSKASGGGNWRRVIEMRKRELESEE